MTNARNVSIAITAALITAVAAWAPWTTPTNVGSGINSGAAELDPAIGANQDTMYFATTRSGGFGGYDIWVSVFAGTWQPAANMGGVINSSGNERAPSWYASGATSYLYYHSDRAGGQGLDDIWRATYFNGVWSGPTVQTPLNSTANDRDPYIAKFSPIQCYFASDRPGGFGGFDIWYSTFVSNAWTTPVNVGSGVNTSYDELGPTINPDLNELYFNSNRPGGYGGYDIYYARPTSGAWGNTQRLPNPPNSSAFDGTPERSVDFDSFFFASDRSGGYGGYDIYYSKVPVSVTPDSLGRVKVLFK